MHNADHLLRNFRMGNLFILERDLVLVMEEGVRTPLIKHLATYTMYDAFLNIARHALFIHIIVVVINKPCNTKYG